ncbi:hypothetical protein ACJX0J_023438, partial [Zea mays]
RALMFHNFFSLAMLKYDWNRIFLSLFLFLLAVEACKYWTQYEISKHMEISGRITTFGVMLNTGSPVKTCFIKIVI